MIAATPLMASEVVRAAGSVGFKSARHAGQGTDSPGLLVIVTRLGQGEVLQQS